MSRESQPNVIAVSGTLDYFTITSPKSPLEHLKFMRIGGEILEAAKQTGEKVTGACIKGFIGEKCDGVAFAQRPKDNCWILRVEGPSTEMVVQAAIDSKLEGNCKRLDPAMNWQFDRGVQFYGEDLRKQIRAHERAEGRTERTAFTLFEKAKQDTGGTIGDRSSAIYPRIYDWALYHLGKSDMDIWRGELETKAEAAARAWEQMKSARDRSKLAIDMVATRLSQHGIKLKGLKDITPVPLVGTRPPSDIDRWMKWFTGTILPSMEKKWDEGHEERILEALRVHGWIDEDGAFSRTCETA